MDSLSPRVAVTQLSVFKVIYVHDLLKIIRNSVSSVQIGFISSDLLRSLLFGITCFGSFQFSTLALCLYSDVNLCYRVATHCLISVIWNKLFSHTQQVSVTLGITLCLSASSSLLAEAAWTLVFRLLLSNRCTNLLQIVCGCSLGGPLLSLLKSRCYPYFSWNYG